MPSTKPNQIYIILNKTIWIKIYMYFLRKLYKKERKYLEVSSFRDMWLYCNSFSHSTNILGKGMNPIILPLAMGKL